jgi:predicted DNA-binding ribbon-helix-helix protein
MRDPDIAGAPHMVNCNDSAGRRTRLSGLVKRSFSLAGHRTSVALEAEFWTVLQRMAQVRGQRLSALIAAADAARGPVQPLASALRVMALLGNEAGVPQADVVER